MRDLGTPVFARKLFKNVLLQFPNNAELCVVRLGARPVAAGLIRLEEPFLFDVLGSKEDVEEALAESGVQSPLLLLLMPEQIERLKKTIDFDLPTYGICYVALHEDPNSSNWGKILSCAGVRYLHGCEEGICLLFSSDDGASVALALALARIQ